MKIKLILALAPLVLMTGCYNIGQGEKIGQVVKVNEASGLIYKTVEVEIIRGGFSNGSGTNGQALHFTIENNPNAVALVKKAMIDGSEIKVQYHEELATIGRSDSGNTFGDKIEVLSAGKRDVNSTIDATVSNADMLKIINKQQDIMIKMLEQMKK